MTFENCLVHETDDAGAPTGEPLYSGDRVGCLRFINESGINSLAVTDAETSASVTSAFQESRAAVLVAAFGAPQES